MSEVEDKIAKNRNLLYYNQLLKNESKRDPKEQSPSKQKKKSFGSQKVEIKDFAPVPEGWENFVYAFYVIALPYILGAIFLFFAVAGGRYENFKLLDTSAFFIVWLIGYEIASVILLCWILVLYLQYDPKEEHYY